MTTQGSTAEFLFGLSPRSGQPITLESINTLLERAALSFRLASSIAVRDREYDGEASVLADQCELLVLAISNIEEPLRSRLAATVNIPLHNLLTDTISSLSALTIGLRKVKTPKPPTRHKPQAATYLLVTFLANVFEDISGRRATITKDSVIEERKGDFVRFVGLFCAEYLGKDAPPINPSAIERGLKIRRKTSDPSITKD